MFRRKTNQTSDQGQLENGKTNGKKAKKRRSKANDLNTVSVSLRCFIFLLKLFISFFFYIIDFYDRGQMVSMREQNGNEMRIDTVLLASYKHSALYSIFPCYSALFVFMKNSRKKARKYLNRWMRGSKKNYGNFKEFESVNIGEKIQFFEQELGLSICTVLNSVIDLFRNQFIAYPLRVK